MQFSCLMATTAEDSFNVFRPNLEPVDDDKNEADAGARIGNDNVAMMSSTEETKQDTSSAAEESKR